MSDSCCGNKGKEKEKSGVVTPYAVAAGKGPVSEYIIDSGCRKKLESMIDTIDKAIHKSSPNAVILIVSFLEEMEKIPQNARKVIEDTILGAHSCQNHIRTAISAVRWQIEAGKRLSEIDQLLHSSNPNQAIPQILEFLDFEGEVPSAGLIDAVFAARGSCAGHLKQTIEAVKKQALAQMS